MSTLLADLTQGDPVDAVYRIKQVVLRQTPQGKAFILGELQDRSGQLGFVWWQVKEQEQQMLQQATYAHVHGRVDRHKERLQIVVQRAREVQDKEVDPAQFLAVGDFDVEAGWRELTAIIASVGNAYIKSLLSAIFLDDKGFGDLFRQAPAAVSMHHAHLHGLLEHSLAVCHLAQDLATRYQQLDRDLLVAGALLHDCCKVYELDWSTSLKYTVAGNLVGHIPQASNLVARKAAAIPDFPERLLIKIQHLILSHHGRLEFGAAKEPQLLEAVVLHLIDNLDSRIAGFTGTVSGSTSVDPDWTEVSRMFGYRLYRGE